MRTERRLFLWMAAFMLPLGASYAIIGHYMTGIEIAGTILLAIVSVTFAFIGTYLWLQERKIDERPHDLSDAQIAEGAGTIGTFPSASIWPFVAAIGVTTIGYGLIFSFALLIPGIAMLFATVVGMAREGYDPHH